MTYRGFNDDEHVRSEESLAAIRDLISVEISRWELAYPQAHPVTRALRCALSRVDKAAALRARTYGDELFGPES